MEKHLEYAEASRISGLSVGHLRNLVSQGKLRSVKDAAERTLIPESALHEHQQQAVKYTAPTLLKALQDRQKADADRPENHLLGAVEILNLCAEGLHGGSASPFLKFLSKHEELRPAVAQLVNAAMNDLARETSSRARHEELNRAMSKAAPFVRGMMVAAVGRKLEGLEKGVAFVKEMEKATAKKSK